MSMNMTSAKPRYNRQTELQGDQFRALPMQSEINLSDVDSRILMELTTEQVRYHSRGRTLNSVG